VDTQGRRHVDPADQWVFDPETGSYQLRQDPQPGAGDPSARRIPTQPGGRRDRREQQDSPRDTPPGSRRRGAGGGSAPPASRRKAKPKKSGKKKALIWTAGSVGFVLVAVSVGGYLAYQHFNGNISTVDTGGIGSKNATSNGPVNILVIGTDSRAGLGTKYGDVGSVGHADTTILFHVSKDRTNATALSIPRDIITDIPDCPTKQKDGTTKIIPGTDNVRFNTSLGQDGRDPGCTMRTVKALTGITPDHFMMANFEAVKDLSTAVGGVEVCLAKNIDDPDSHLKLSAGRHTVEGEQALAFVRTRHSVGFGGDLSRIQLQQQFLSSMIRKMKSGGTLTNPTKLFDLANVATKALTVDTGLGSVDKLVSMAGELQKVPTNRITMATMPWGADPQDPAAHVVPTSAATKLFTLLRNDTAVDGKSSTKKTTTTASASPTATATASPKADIAVTVQNGTGNASTAAVSGRASAIVTELSTLGYTQATADSTAESQSGTTISYPSDDLKANAQAVAKSLKLPTSAVKKSTPLPSPTARLSPCPASVSANARAWLTPPLAATTATFPGLTWATPGTKLAITPAWGARNPLVLGPSSLMPVARTTSASRRWYSMPGPPASANPPPQITAAPTPAAAASARTSGQAAAGTQITARSTGPYLAASATEPYMVSPRPLTSAR
jgi:LCP family protein required for cell wall assembly